MAGYIKLQIIKEIDGEDAIHIRDRAFQAMPFMVDAQFPEAITVGGYAFTMCNTLTTLDFPKVEEIGVGAFSDCSKVETVNFSELVTVGQDGFMGLEKLYKIFLPKAEKIGDQALKDCKSLVEAAFPSATELGQGVFDGCVSLERAYVARLQSAGEDTFKNCPTLKELSLPGLKKVSMGLVNGCSELTSLDVPFAKSIEEGAFDGCDNLQFLNLQTAESLPDNLFEDLTSLRCINLKGSGILSRYMSVPGSRAYGLVDSCDVVGVDGVYSQTTSGQPFFRWQGNGIVGISSEHPKRIYDVYASTFGQDVFQENQRLESLYLPRVSSIPRQSFLNCHNLDKVEFPNANSIGEQAFLGCNNLKYVCLSSMKMDQIRPQLLGIQKGCIVVCQDGTLVVSADGWEELNPRKPELDENMSYAFLDDGTMVELDWVGEVDSAKTFLLLERHPRRISIGNKVTGIGNCAFMGFGSLQRISIPNTVASIGENSFKDSGLVEITLPDAVGSIGRGSFSGCKSLYRAILPYGIQQIPDETFLGCESLLGTIDIPASATRIGDRAFMGCCAICENPMIRIHKDVVEIGEDAFSGINGLILFKGRTMSQIRAIENYPWGIEKYEVQVRAGETERLESF